jgi:hypothetical protein
MLTESEKADIIQSAIDYQERFKDDPVAKSMKTPEDLYRFIGMQLKNKQAQFVEGLKHIYTPTFEEKD